MVVFKEYVPLRESGQIKEEEFSRIGNLMSEAHSESKTIVVSPETFRIPGTDIIVESGTKLIVK